jgi:CheY-like chemotaxis protein
MIEPLMARRGQRLTLPTLGSSPVVFADRTRLKQVLLNLLSNAIKYNVIAGLVAVNWFAVTPNVTRVTVRDTGAGLSPEKLTQLFQPFNRLGQEGGREEGTGIGLVMSKLLVEQMGGRIGVESTVGTGSVFWFELSTAPPQASQPDPTEVSAVVQAEATHPLGAALVNLLYVEDNPANMKLVAGLIARRPELRLLGATNATLGIEIARNSQPDVILMDINLPGISGIQALKLLRDDPLTAHIPVLAISANAMMGDIRKGMDAGFFNYLTKPIIVREFLDALDLALDFARANLAIRRARVESGEPSGDGGKAA